MGWWLQGFLWLLCWFCLYLSACAERRTLETESAVGGIAMRNEPSFLAEVLCSGRRETSHEMVTFDSRVMEALEALQRGAITIWDTSPTAKVEKPRLICTSKCLNLCLRLQQRFERGPKAALRCGWMGAAGIPAGCGAVPVAWSQEALSVPREGCSKGFPA